MNAEQKLRDRIARWGERLHIRGYAPGSSGNISVRLDDGFLVTPTNSCLGFLETKDIAKLTPDGVHDSGNPASKEAFLHTTVLTERPADHAVVHLHSTYSVALSCCAGLNADAVLTPLTPYTLMKAGRVALIDYFAPGDIALAKAVGKRSKNAHALLLSNHGPVVSGRDLDSAIYAIEEIEEAAKLDFLLEGRTVRPLSAAAIADINNRFPS